jgi:dTDP-4-dehydrorhamnose 3,5-epimerase
MKITATPLAGLMVLERMPIGDHRGYFERLYDNSVLAEAGICDTIVQINHSYSAKKGTVRGLHFQYPPYAEDKIVYCLSGEIFDVAVDIRQDSPTFLQWHAEILTAKNHKALVIPKGFAHGFQALTDDVELVYLVTSPYTRESESGILANDPMLNIVWPLSFAEQSPRDISYASLDHFFTGVAL